MAKAACKAVVWALALCIVAAPSFAKHHADPELLSCSADQAVANINELSDKDGGAFYDFIEIKILQDNTDITGWQLCVAEDGKGTVCATLGVGRGYWGDVDTPHNPPANPDNISQHGNTLFDADTWITYDDKTNAKLRADANRGEVLLLDGSGQVLDYIAYDSAGDSCGVDRSGWDQDRWEVPVAPAANSCGVCFDGKLSSNKNLRRQEPDGTGSWTDSNQDPTTGTDNDSPAIPAGQWLMDEATWGSAPAGVVDSGANGLNGQAFNGADTIGGSCRYGYFDGVDDYIEIPHSDLLDGDDALTYMARVRPDSWTGVDQIMAKSVHAGGAGRAQMGIFSESGVLKARVETLAGSYEVTGTLPAPRGDWVHVAAVFDGAALRLYLDGVEVAASTFGATTLVKNGDPLNIGKQVGVDAYYFHGLLDDVRLYRQALSQQQIADAIAETSPCSLAAGIDHYRISHAGSGVNCEASAVTISGYDSSGSAVAPANGTTLALSSDSSAASFVPATVTFDGAMTQVVVSLLQPTPATVDIDLLDSDGVRESASYDPSLTFSAAGFKFYDASADSENVPPQIAGKRSDLAPGDALLQLRAIITDPATGACVPRISDAPVAVAFAYQCVDPASCVAGQQLRIADSGASEVALPDSLSISFDGNGRGAIPLRYTDAGRVQLTASAALDADPGAVPPLPAVTLSGASVPFTVVPAGFCVKAPESDGDCAAQDGSCSRFKAAGESFVLSIEAVGWESAGESDSDFCAGNSVTPNFSATAIGLSHQAVISDAAASWQPGALAVAALDMDTGGSASVASQSISEVGVFSITATPPLYFGEPLAAAASAPIGRFTPAYFALTGATVVERSDLSCTDPFTYMGETFTLDLTLAARNLGGTVTQNYQRSFNRFAQFGDLGLVAVDQGGSGTALSGRVTEVAGLSLVASAGVVSAAIPLTIARGAAADGPFNQLLIGSRAADGDGIALRPADYDLDTDLDGDDDSVWVGDQSQVRFGRLTISNAFGPETGPIDQRVSTEYFNGQGFSTHADDNCSRLLGGELLFSDLQGTLYGASLAVPSVGLAVAGGEGAISYTAPGAGNPGVVAVQGDLAAYPWLRFDWDGDGNHDEWDGIADGPRGEVTFGRYRGNDRIMFWQENFSR